jgi:hypothetical protein
MKPRVFISHAAGPDPDVWELVEAIEAELEDAGFEVFLDRSKIPRGDQWRPEIEAALPTCNCGVVVLSDRALDRPFVIFEAGFLASRARQETPFRIVPVLWRGTAFPDDDRWEPAALDAHNPVRADDAATAAGEVAAALRPVRLRLADDRELTWRPKLGSVLAGARPAALEAAAAALGRQLDFPWSADPPESVAHFMLTAGDIESVFEAALALRDNDDYVDACRAFEIALPHAWIDWDAACRVRDAVDGRSALALDTVLLDTGKMYVKRASHKLEIATPTNVNGGDDEVEELRREVRAELQQVFGALGDDDLRAELDGADVVVLLPFEPPSREAVAAVRADFPATLLFCAGDGARATWIDAEGDVPVIEPPVDRAREVLAHRKASSAPTRLTRRN